MCYYLLTPPFRKTQSFFPFFFPPDQPNVYATGKQCTLKINFVVVVVCFFSFFLYLFFMRVKSIHRTRSVSMEIITDAAVPGVVQGEKKKKGEPLALMTNVSECYTAGAADQKCLASRMITWKIRKSQERIKIKKNPSELL